MSDLKRQPEGKIQYHITDDKISSNKKIRPTNLKFFMSVNKSGNLKRIFHGKRSN